VLYGTRHTKGRLRNSTQNGDAAFFSAVQLLTVSSQIKNPLTTAGKVVDVALEV